MPAYQHLVVDDPSPAVPHLASFEGCPFAQTTRIVLAHKGIRFRHSEVPVFDEQATAIADKPAWFLALSPKGRVPILEHQGRVLYESAIVDQYLDEVYPDPPLVPSDPWLRGVCRIWLQQVSVTLPRLWYRCLVASGDALAPAQDRLLEWFAELDEALAERGGPWLLGDFFSLADVFVAPFYERFDAVHLRYGKFALPDDGSLPHVRVHWRAVLSHPAVLATRLDPDWLFHLYRPFARDEQWISAENNKAVRDIVD